MSGVIMIDVFERFAETRGRRSLKKKEKKRRKEGRKGKHISGAHQRVHERWADEN